MPSSFIRDMPLQFLKLTAVISVLALGGAVIAGLLPGQNLSGLLVLAFFPMILAVVVGAEALFAGYRLATAGGSTVQYTPRRLYTTIRVIELVVTVAAPGVFYILVVQIGGEVPGPGAIGLLFIGIALGLVAYLAVLGRTLLEYIYHRRRSGSTEPGDRSSTVVE